VGQVLPFPGALPTAANEELKRKLEHFVS